MAQEYKLAHIILEDGTEFEGESFGYEGSISGETIFYTGAGNLQKVLTAPALRGALVVLPTAVVGITGIAEDVLDSFGLEEIAESAQIHAAGLIVQEYCDTPSHPSAHRNLGKWLKKHQVPAISGVDTRALIQRLRSRGSMRGKILVSGERDVSFSSAHLHNRTVQVSTKKPVIYGSGEKRIVLIDCGVRNSTIRALLRDDTRVERLPAGHDYTNSVFDGLVIAGGPGDPTSCEKTIEYLKKALSLGKPIFAVGQGTVLMALASGASAYRMAQGHRGENVPCINLHSGACHITAQNHGYGIREDSLPPQWSPTFLNNNDNSIEGISTAKGLISGVLFQPEGQSGPDDTIYLYDQFLDLVRHGGVRA